MSEPKVTACPSCGQKNRVRAGASGLPYCGKCGKPLPWLVEAHASDFEAVVEKSPIPVLIDFWAPWCAPCRIIAPAVERLSEELAGRLKVVKLNTDDEPALGQRFGVQSIPTLALLEGGKERDRVVGALNVNALRSWVQARLPSQAVKPQP
ncbi:MAG TPA: thioredoxin [Candidatus Dormibacteraeota bacterium]